MIRRLLLLLLLPVALCAQQTDVTPDSMNVGGGSDSLVVSKARSREYTEDNPLIYEDYSNLPPYAYTDEHGRPAGYNVELVKELLEGLGIKHYKISLKLINDAYQDLKHGSADLILSIKAQKREECGIYGKVPISIFTTSLLVPKSKPLPNVKRLKDLNEEKVLVHTGSMVQDVMTKRGLTENMLPVTDMTQTILRISAQDSGMVLWNTMSMKYIIDMYHLTNLQLQPVHDLHTDLRFISHDTLLLAKLDSAYQVRQSDPELIELRRKWFYPENNSNVHAGILNSAGVIVLVAVVAMVVYFWFRRREREYTEHFRHQNLQLSLYLTTGGISMWSYKVSRKTFSPLNGKGEEEGVMEPNIFGERYDHMDFANVLLAIEQIVAGVQDTYHGTVRRKGKDGKNQYFDLQISVLERDMHGRPRILLGMQSNITEQRQKHIELQEMLLKFHTAFNVSNAWLLCFGRDGKLININQAACNEFGITDPQALINDEYTIGEIPFDLESTNVDKGQEVWMSAYVDFDQYRAAGRFNPHITAKGQAYHELIIMPVTDHKGQHLATYVAGLNITESVETAHESRSRANEIEFVYRMSQQGMSNLSHSLAFAQILMGYYSPATHVLSFGGEQNMRSLTSLEVVMMAARKNRLRMTHILKRMDRREMASVEVKCVTRLRDKVTRANRVFMVSVLPVAGSDGLADHYIVLTRDITGVERLQEQLEHETAKALEAEQIKNAFLRNMSAEISRPLSRMLESANKLLGLKADEDSNEEATMLSGNILSTCRNLLSLVGDILTLSKIEAGMEPVNIDTVDMAVLFPAICQMSAGRCDSKRVKVKVEGTYECLEIETDADYITRIIEGLFSCSLLTTSDGLIRATCDYFNGQLVIRVEDTGVGMTSDQIAAVGDHRFSGEDSQYDLSIKMAIVQELARRLGGRLDVESSRGHGTTVWVTLPSVAHQIKLHTAEDNETA